MSTPSSNADAQSTSKYGRVGPLKVSIFTVVNQSPSQTPKMQASLEALASHGDRLLILGDLKHRIPSVGYRENKEIVPFMEHLGKCYKSITLVAGNHDGGISSVLPQGVKAISSRGMTIEDTGFLSLLEKTYPDARLVLRYKNPLELLVATILAAQCTDEGVNKVTEALFKKYKTAQDYANTKQDVFEQEIRSAGFYKNKAKNIIACSKDLVERFDGKVPDTMEDLVTLSGVGRKTASVLLGKSLGNRPWPWIPTSFAFHAA